VQKKNFPSRIKIAANHTGGRMQGDSK
jgi:hypothetical protein